jgi:hypothetical protein
MKKRTYVLWSGGLDSTYLIQKLLDENKEQEIVAGYVEVENNSEKVKMEKAAIARMVPFFQKHYGYRFSYHGVVMSLHVKNPGSIIHFSQMPLWINSVISTARDIDEVAFGYVMNDDAISHLEDIRKIFRAYKPICAPKFPKITFPLSKMKKEHFVDALYEELRSNVVWCEFPKQKGNTPDQYEYCGNCVPCSHSPIVVRQTHNVKENSFHKLIKSDFVEVFNGCNTEEKKHIIETVLELKHNLPLKQLEFEGMETSKPLYDGPVMESVAKAIL